VYTSWNIVALRICGCICGYKSVGLARNYAPLWSQGERLLLRPSSAQPIKKQAFLWQQRRLLHRFGLRGATFIPVRRKLSVARPSAILPSAAGCRVPSRVAWGRGLHRRSHPRAAPQSFPALCTRTRLACGAAVYEAHATSRGNSFPKKVAKHPSAPSANRGCPAPGGETA
jgi:hypothetical protein